MNARSRPRVAAVRALTFDVTGTLITPRQPGVLYREVLARHGVQLEAGKAEAALRQALEEMRLAAAGFEDPFTAHRLGARGWWGDVIARVCRLAGASPPSRFAAAELFERFRAADAWSMPEALPGRLATLRAAGLRLAVIANWDDRLDGVLAALGLADHLDAIVRSSQVGVVKPHPAIFKRALELLEAEPPAVLHLGNDAVLDVEGAQAVGMLARQVEDPDHLAALLDEVLEEAPSR